jgi:hypothetical protein
MNGIGISKRPYVGERTDWRPVVVKGHEGFRVLFSGKVGLNEMFEKANGGTTRGVLTQMIVFKGISVRSFSLCGDGLSRGGRAGFQFGHTLSVFGVIIALGVFCEELDSQFGHLCRIIPLIFWVNVLLLEFLLGENRKLWYGADILPCAVVVERICGRGLVIVKGEPKENASTRK